MLHGQYSQNINLLRILPSVTRPIDNFAIFAVLISRGQIVKTTASLVMLQGDSGLWRALSKNRS